MRLLFIFAITLFSVNFCSSQINITKSANGDTDSLYPSPDIVIPYHSAWTKTHYIERIAEFKANPLQFGDIVFIGNSITEQGGDWGQRFNNPKAKNRGISGDVSAGVINRLAEICYYKPEKVFIKIGINDLFHNELTPEYIANNIKLIVDKIHLESPETKIYVQTILPSRDNSPPKEKIIATNAILKAMTPSDNLKIIDLFSVFANSNNLMNTGLTKDNLHLNETGYDLWENSIREFVNSNALGVEELNLEKQYVLYPNPVEDILNLKNTNGLKTESLKITNILGETVYYDDIAKEKNIVDVSKLSSGIYILTVVSQDNNKNQFKFIKK